MAPRRGSGLRYSCRVWVVRAFALSEQVLRRRDVSPAPSASADTAGVMYEESTGTLLCGDLFTQLGNGPALTEDDTVGPAIASEDLFNYSSLNPEMGATIRALADLSPRRLALMPGPSFAGDGAAALRALADNYDSRISERWLAIDRLKAA